MSDCFDVRKDSPTIRKANGAYIAALMEDMLEPMRLAARGCGYALTVHGTLKRDIDLVAIPWTVSADDKDLLVKHLCGVIAGFTGRALPENKWVDKPHGRKTIMILHGGHDGEIDLSVMPVIEGKSDAS